MRGLGNVASLLAIALIATVGFGPIANARHELTVRHVVCAEHGELTHVPANGGARAEPEREATTISSTSTDIVDGHEHCSNGFLVRARLHFSVIRSAFRFTPPPAIAREVCELAPSPGRAFVLASAPKTSPPSA